MTQESPEPPGEPDREGRVISRRQMLAFGLPALGTVTVCAITPFWEKMVDQVWPPLAQRMGLDGGGGPVDRPQPSPDLSQQATPPLNGIEPTTNSTGEGGEQEPVPRGQSQIVRAGVAESDWQTVLDQVRVAGYQLVFMDGHEVEGKPYLNAIFRAADHVAWESRSSMTGSVFDKKLSEMKAGGYRITNITSYLTDGQVRYGAIWRKERGPAQIIYRGLNQSAHDARVDALLADGYRPLAVTVATPNDSPEWTVLYEKRLMRGPWYLKTLLTLNQYDREWNEAHARGQHPIYLSATEYRGQPRISSIWDTDTGWRESRYGLTAANLIERAAANDESGAKLLAVAGYNSFAGSARFAATWSK